VSKPSMMSVPAGWRGELREVQAEIGSSARLGIRYARSGDLVDAYPAGTHDLELAVDGRPTEQAVRDFVSEALTADPLSRRVVLPVPERDLDILGWAENAGFRFVVSVETRVGEYSLLVVEPDWVIAQPQALEDIPVKE